MYIWHTILTILIFANMDRSIIQSVEVLLMEDCDSVVHQVGEWGIQEFGEVVR